jgi:hypothetical protein
MDMWRNFGRYPWRGRMGFFVPWRCQVSGVRQGCQYSDAAPAWMLQIGG